MPVHRPNSSFAPDHIPAAPDIDEPPVGGRSRTGETLGSQATYWCEALAGAPPLLELPTDRKRPMRQDFRGGCIGLELDRTLTSDLRALSRRHGLTLYGVFQLKVTRTAPDEESVLFGGVARAGRSSGAF